MYGSFDSAKLSTGLALAPEVFQRYARRMLHMKPVLDSEGKPVYEAPNVVKLIDDPLIGVEHFFDDVFMMTPAYATWELTLEAHARTVEQVMSRINFHSGKIHFELS